MWILYFISFIILSVQIDTEHLQDNDFIESHRSRWLIRGTFMIAAAVDVFSFFAMFFYWIGLFDSILNLAMKKELNHLGTTADWDKFWNKHKKVYTLTKLASIILGILFTIYNLHTS